MNAPVAKVALIADPACKEHDSGVGHPEAPGRFDAVMMGLADAGLTGRMLRLEPKEPLPADLRRVHAAGYLATAEREIKEERSQLSTGDTSVGPHSWDAALRAAGSGIAAVDAVISGNASRAFCVVRPPGHHATPEKGMGFCVLNNIAIAARYAQAEHGVERVLIVDWDVHHGNGTQDVFYQDPSVFFFSTHQAPWYPGTGAAGETGEGKGIGTTLNCPLPAGSGRTEVMAAFETRLLPAMAKFRPEMIFISAGFDSRIMDPLGRFTLEDRDFADLTRIVTKLAGEHGGGRVVSMLEGGYNLEGLKSAATAHVAALF